MKNSGFLDGTFLDSGGPEGGAVPDLGHLVQSGTGDFREKSRNIYGKHGIFGGNT